MSTAQWVYCINCHKKKVSNAESNAISNSQKFNFFLNYSMFLSRFPSLGQYYYPPAQPQPQPSGNGSMLPQPRLGYMMYDSTSPDFQQQPSVGQMMMLPQLTTPPMYRFPQQQPQQQYVYVQQPSATPVQGVTPLQTQNSIQAQFPAQQVTPVTPPAVPVTPSTEQNEETPPSSSEKNRSNWKRQKDKNKDNEIEKKGHGDNDVLKDGKCDTSLESKEKSPLAQKLSDDDDSIVYLKMHSSFLLRPKIQKLLQESQQNSNEQLGSNASKSTGLDQTSQLQQTVTNIQQPPVPSLPAQHQLPPTMQPPSAVQPVQPVAPVTPVMPVQYQQQYFLPTAPYVGVQ